MQPNYFPVMMVQFVQLKKDYIKKTPGIHKNHKLPRSPRGRG